MNFLKKIGLGIIKYVPLILTGAQLFGATNPAVKAVVDRFSVIFGAGMQIEKDFAKAFPGQKTGPQKLLALSAQVEDILRQSELASGHEIADEVLLGKAAQGIAQGVVDAMQSFKGKDGATVTTV